MMISWDAIWPWLLLATFMAAPMVIPFLCESPEDRAMARLWCKDEHDWVCEGWFSKCARCPAEYNHHDRPGGAGWG